MKKHLCVHQFLDIFWLRKLRVKIWSIIEDWRIQRYCMYVFIYWSSHVRIIQSSHFIFLVSNKNTSLIIHAVIVKNISKSLHALINNDCMKESNVRVAILENVKVKTFVEFCEYAYTDVYKIFDFIWAQHSNRSNDTAKYSEKSTVESHLNLKSFSKLRQIFSFESNSWCSSFASLSQTKRKKKKMKIFWRVVCRYCWIFDHYNLSLRTALKTISIIEIQQQISIILFKFRRSISY